MLLAICIFSGFRRSPSKVAALQSLITRIARNFTFYVVTSLSLVTIVVCVAFLFARPASAFRDSLYASRP